VGAREAFAKNRAPARGWRHEHHQDTEEHDVQEGRRPRSVSFLETPGVPARTSESRPSLRLHGELHFLVPIHSRDADPLSRPSIRLGDACCEGARDELRRKRRANECEREHDPIRGRVKVRLDGPS
jgi:hypothetical protein